MNKCRGLKRLPRLLMRELLGGQTAQFIVDEGQQLLCGLGVTVIDGTENLRDFRHRRPRICAHCQSGGTGHAGVSLPDTLNDGHQSMADNLNGSRLSQRVNTSMVDGEHRILKVWFVLKILDL